MATHPRQKKDRKQQEKVKLNDRLEGIAWGLFLLMIGGQAFVSPEIVAKGSWPLGVGIILLGLNATRYYYQLRMSGFTTILGIIALCTGVGELFGYDLPVLAILLILLGINLLLKPWFEMRQLFGEVEEM